MSIELYEHQRTALDLMRLNDGFALLLEQGLGKTFPVLFRMAELADNGRIRSALVVCPKAVIASWEGKIGLLDDGQRASIRGIDLKICSYDWLWRQKDVLAATWDMVVFDESHFIKSPSAKRTKGCLKVAVKAKYRYILTGTPMSNGQLCDWWSQLAAIDPVKPEKGSYPAYPACFGGISYYKWIEGVAYLNQWRQPYKYKDAGQIQAIVSELSYRATKEERLDLPEKMGDEVLTCRLEPTMKTHYRKMARDSAIAELGTLAENPLTRSLRLRQLCSGFLDTEDGERHEYACSKPAALREFLQGTDEKVVVYCEFRHSIDAVCEVLDGLGMGHVVLDGRQQDKGVWLRFQEDESVRAIVCQYAAASAGIDLYAARLMVFYEPCLSSTLLEQARDRIHRVGQSLPCCYYFLLTEGSIEFAIYGALRNYADFDRAFFTQYIEEYTKGARL